VGFKIAVGTGPAGVDNALRDALVIEMHDLLTCQLIFQQMWPNMSAV
jgi:hypothetical protein